MFNTQDLEDKSLLKKCCATQSKVYLKSRSEQGNVLVFLKSSQKQTIVSNSAEHPPRGDFNDSHNIHVYLIIIILLQG